MLKGSQETATNEVLHKIIKSKIIIHVGTDDVAAMKSRNNELLMHDFTPSVIII